MSGATSLVTGVIGWASPEFFNYIRLYIDKCYSNCTADMQRDTDVPQMRHVYARFAYTSFQVQSQEYFSGREVIVERLDKSPFLL